MGKEKVYERGKYMGKRFVRNIIICLMFAMAFGMVADTKTMGEVCAVSAKPSDLKGDGITSSSAYQIATKEHLLWYSEWCRANSTKNYAILTNDIVLNDVTFTYNASTKQVAWGASTPDEWFGLGEYKGILDGNGHSISGLYSVGGMGLCNDLSGTIKNLTIKNSYIRSSNGACGVIACTATAGSILKCNIESTYVLNNSASPLYYGVGGVIGRVMGGTTKIQNCSVQTKILANVSSDCEKYIGGLVGEVTQSVQISKSYFAGEIYNQGSKVQKPIFGYVTSGTTTLTSCYYDKDVSGANNNYPLDGVTGVSTSAFASGEIAWKLNGSTSSTTTWRQNLGSDSYPIVDATHAVVVQKGSGYANESSETPSHQHTFVHHNAVTATCKVEGFKEYWSCSGCSMLFGTSDGSKIITAPESIGYGSHKVSSVVAVAGADCQTAGTKAYYQCSVCSKRFSSLTATSSTEIKSDSELVDDSNRGEHSLVSHAAVKGADCQTAGTKAYWQCLKCNNYYSANVSGYTAAKSYQISGPQSDATNKGNHSLVKVSAKSASCTSTGNAEYYQCSVTGCGKMFSNITGTTEVTQQQVLIAKLSHTFNPLTQRCSVCGDNVYSIYAIDGSDSISYIKDVSTVSIVINTSDTFKNLWSQGTKVSVTPVTNAGKVTITLPKTYLETLKVGDTYTLVAEFTNGYAKCLLNVINQESLQLTPPVLTGTYGTTVDKLVQDGEKKALASDGKTVIEGKWELTDSRRTTATPEVGSNTTYEMTFTPADSYGGKYKTQTVQARVNILAKDLTASGVSVSSVTGTYTYHAGAVHQPVVTVSDSGARITATDYTISYHNNVNAYEADVDGDQTPYVLITGKGNYKGTVRRYFRIQKSVVTPNQPDATMRVAYAVKKVNEIALNGNWSWNTSDVNKDLTAGGTTYAVATYNGADQGNYVTESVTVSIKRSECPHEAEKMIPNYRYPSCTVKGYTGDETCSECGKVLKAGSDIPALGHSFEKGRRSETLASAATCTEPARYYMQCDICSAVSADKTVAYGTALGHSFPDSSYVQKVAADCEHKGLLEATCVRRGCTEKKTSEIQALGHLYSEQWTSDDSKHWRRCTRTGCTSNIAENAHTWDTVVDQAATVNEVGWQHEQCSVCGYQKSRVEISKIQVQHVHSGVRVAAVAATCEMTGNIEYYRCDCGKYFKYATCRETDVITLESTIIPKAAHQGGVATCASQAECTKCHQKYGAIAPNNHIGGTELRGIVEPTIDYEGYTGDTYCLGCNTKIQTGTSIEKLEPPHEHSFVGEWKTDGDYHWLVCECGEEDIHRAHGGGNATCSQKAVCTTCGKEYGAINPDNHFGGVTIKNAKNPTTTSTGYSGDEYCISCNKLIKTGVQLDKLPSSHVHSYDSMWKTDGQYHWKECECGARDQLIAHTGGSATCRTMARCQSCGAEYGAFDSTKHSLSRKIRGQVEATIDSDGYTGDELCLDCEAVLKQGEVIPRIHVHNYGKTWQKDAEVHWKECACGDKQQIGEHTGGVATCDSKAKCEICGVAYGALDPSNHTGEMIIRNYIAPTMSSYGYTGDKYCKDCNTLISSGQSIDKLPADHVHDYSYAFVIDATTHWSQCSCGALDDGESHYGGNATCTEKAICEECGLAYGSLNPYNHVGEESIRDYQEPSNNQKGYSGDTYCLSCNKVKQQGHELAKIAADHEHEYGEWEHNDTEHWCICEDCGAMIQELHNGGEATCIAKAICAKCDVEYGDVDATNHKGERIVKNAKEASVTEAGYTGDRYCADCDELAEAGTVIAKLPAPETPTPEPVPNDNLTFDVKVTGSGEVSYEKPKQPTANVVIPDTVTVDGVSYAVTSIDKNAFKNDKTIKTITVGKHIEKIDSSAFENCTNLKTVTISSNVTEIGDKAFYKCTSLTKVSLPANVTKIGKDAFSGSKKLKTITIKSTKIKSIGKNALKGISKKAVIKVPKKMYKKYKKLLTAKTGFKKTMKIKKS